MTKACHRHSRATLLIRTLTKHKDIGGTRDIMGVTQDKVAEQAWGYSGIRKLPANKNLEHSETYALFANGRFGKSSRPEIYALTLRQPYTHPILDPARC